MKILQELTKEQCIHLAKVLLYPSNKKSSCLIVEKIIEKDIIINKISDNDSIQIIIPFASMNLLVVMVDEEVGLQIILGYADIEDNKIVSMKYGEQFPQELAIVRAAHYLYTQGYNIGIERGIFKEEL